MDIQEKPPRIRHMLATDVSPETRKEIKVLAAKRNMTMNLWLNNAIIRAIKEDTKYDI